MVTGDGSPSRGETPLEFADVFEAVVRHFPAARDSSEPGTSRSFVGSMPNRAKKPPTKFVLYKEIPRLRQDVQSRVASLGAEARRPSAVLQARRPAYRPPSGSQPLSLPKFDEAFNRLTSSRLSSTTSLNITMEEVKALTNAFSSQLEAQSFSMWIISTLYSLVHSEEFDPSDLSLFDQLFSSLGTAMEDQVSHTLSFGAFLSLSRRHALAKFLYPSLTSKQKARLYSGDPFGPNLFVEEDLSSVIAEVEGAETAKSTKGLNKALSSGNVNLPKPRSDSRNTRPSSSGRSDSGPHSRRSYRPRSFPRKSATGPFKSSSGSRGGKGSSATTSKAPFRR